MEYSIGEFSKLTNPGIHTLRYYEHEGLITPKRNASNRQALNDQIAQLQEHKIKLDEKIEFYRNEIERVNTRGAG